MFYKDFQGILAPVNCDIMKTFFLQLIRIPYNILKGHESKMLLTKFQYPSAIYDQDISVYILG